MNREVHYIFSIQTRDYLKSAWERRRRVYLVISPIAHCRADASGNFTKAVARGDRTAVSCLSNLQNTKGLIKRKEATTTTTWWLCLLLSVQQKTTHTTHACKFYREDWCESIVLFKLLTCHLLLREMLFTKCYWTFIPWRVMCVAYILQQCKDDFFCIHLDKTFPPSFQWSDNKNQQNGGVSFNSDMQVLCACVSVWPLRWFVPACSLVQVAVRWQERLGGWGSAEKRSWAQLPGIKQWPLHNERWRQHFPLITRFHTVTRFAYSYSFSLHLPTPLFFPPQFILFPWAGHLPPWHCSGRVKINKYVCREAHDLSRCHRNMARCWHLRAPRPCVFFHGLSTRKSCLGSVEKNTVWAGKTWQRSGK